MRGRLPHLSALLAALLLLTAFTGDAAALRRGATFIVTATAYTGGGLTASGLKTGRGRCAVDPRVIPLGTRFHVQGYGTCLAADTGGGIIGRTIDIWLRSEHAANAWGIRKVRIRILCVRCRAGA